MSATATSPVLGDHVLTGLSALPATSPRARNDDASQARLLGQPVRLGMLRALLTTESLSFVELKHLMNTTDGNLSMHARKLEDAQIVSCTKGFQGRFPRTEYRLTPAGRQAIEQYLLQVE
jgi:DNA-binding MarR family transcriptional regulator